MKIREEREASKKDDDPDSNLSIMERVSKSVIPYAHLSYEEQVCYCVCTILCTIQNLWYLKTIIKPYI